MKKIEGTKEISYFDYKSRTNKIMKIPNCTRYEYLVERNRNFMNYIAISTEDGRKISYEELHEKIDEYAKALSKKGIRKSDLVAVCSGNTPEAIYLIYALDKIGAINIGLSPLNNKTQMRRDIEMICPQYLITLDMFYGNAKDTIKKLNISPILYSPLESLNSPLIKTIYNLKQFFKGNKLWGTKYNLDKIVKNGKDYNADFEIIDSGYVSDIIFTGGSTGVHKGTELYGNGFNYITRALDEIYILEPGQVHLGNIPVNHMVFGKYLTHYVLCNNLEYALTNKMMPNDFTDEVIRTQASGITGGPIHFENLIDNPRITKGSLKNVVQATSGGEYFKSKQKKEAENALRRGGSKAIIANALGATETSSISLVNFLDTRDYDDLEAYPFNIDYEKNPGTCGYPIPGLNYKIVDPVTLKEVAKGSPGLLLLNGESIMKGYYNNPKETEKAFVYFDDKSKWLNTGDIVCNVGENLEEITFAGRKKRNFVCNVTNIYPEEIEEILLRFEEIRESIITPIPDKKYQFLPSYHISLNFECNVDTLKNRIEELVYDLLGEDALPGYISFTLEPLPKTANSKLNVALIQEQEMVFLKNGNELKCVKRNY